MFVAAKKSYQEYRDSIFNILDLKKGGYVIEGIYTSIGDDENQSQRVFDELIPYAKKVYILEHGNKINHIASLIDRSIGRFNGTEPQGVYPETRESRAKLLIHSIEGYSTNEGALEELKKMEKM